MIDALFPVASLEDMVAIVGGLLVTVLIPLVAILTAHQRKMAELLRHQHQIPDQLARDQEMARQMHELRQIVAQQTIALDNLSTSQARIAKALEQHTDVTDRLSSSG